MPLSSALYDCAIPDVPTPPRTTWSLRSAAPATRPQPAQPREREVERVVSPTVRTLLDIPSLSLVLRAGRVSIDRRVTWVAVSELADPTPYLEGGELLLTTGLRLTDDDWPAFVTRLGHAEIGALGIGVGLTHERVPSQLIAAADKAGLPLLEVPEPTPFIAVTRAVADLLASAEYESVTRTVEVQRDLTRAALAPEGGAAVIARLSAVLKADLLLLDGAARLLHAAPREAAVWEPVLGEEVERMRQRGPRSASSFQVDDVHLAVQP